MIAQPRAFVKTLPNRPGIYRMFNAVGDVLYVGKARNLKKRVASYFKAGNVHTKTQALMAQIDRIEVTVTANENEALLLESNLIKDLKPRYNVVLRDDKSYPYIHLSADAQYPRLSFYRGARREAGRYFGPYPSASSVRESLQLLQKIFPVRQCEDSFYRNRTRPCLQYQIKRCSAPCVKLIEPQDYQEDVRHAVLFLEGKNHLVIDELISRMTACVERLEFERAAVLRDQIAALRRIQEAQCVSGEHGDLDVIACAAKNGIACVQVFYIRNGRNLGNKAYFPAHVHDLTAPEILAGFIPQFYLDRDIPGEILVSHPPLDMQWLEEALHTACGHKVSLSTRVRGMRARWLDLASTNAQQTLALRLADQAGMHAKFVALQEALALEQLPQRLECFDVSHSHGEAPVASCVVFDHNGALKTAYRRFNIEDVPAGDDYGALKQALTRHYTRLRQNEAVLPDVLFIDGGPGQLNVARAVLAELQVTAVMIVGIAKGVERRPGCEVLHIAGRSAPVSLAPDSIALHLIQQIRDEAHRFAITGHRARRARARNESPLENIPGMGPKRRKQLLSQFGGMKELKRAGVEDLAKVAGISRGLAQRVYAVLHGENDSTIELVEP